jgi:hypothetical protein
VRKGLAVLGVAVALVGIGVMIAAFSLSPGPSGSFVENVTIPEIAGHGNFTKVVAALIESSALVDFNWGATQSVQVGIYIAGYCADNTSICPIGAPLDSWWSNSGVWLYTGAVSTPWFLKIVNPNGSSAGFNSTLVETYPAPGHTPLSGWWVTLLIVGALVLIAIGALAVFLGSFLRGGVYGPRPPLTPPPDSALLGPPDDEWDDFEDDGPPDDPAAP